jgi:hypothetical protein
MMVTASHPLAGPVARPSHTQARREGPVPAQGEDAGCVSGVSGMGPERACDRPLSEALSLSGSVGFSDLPRCPAPLRPLSGPSETVRAGICKPGHVRRTPLVGAGDEPDLSWRVSCAAEPLSSNKTASINLQANNKPEGCGTMPSAAQYRTVARAGLLQAGAAASGRTC